MADLIFILTCIGIVGLFSGYAYFYRWRETQKTLIQVEKDRAKAIKPPHIKYPELKHWQKGDKIKYKDLEFVCILPNEYYTDEKRYTGLKTGDVNKWQDIEYRGKIVFQHTESGEYIEKKLRRVMRRGYKNFSLEQRKLEQKINKDSVQEYQELVEHFQAEFERLEAQQGEDSIDLTVENNGFHKNGTKVLS